MTMFDNLDEKLRESFDSLEKAITEHLVDSPPEFNKTVDNHFWEMAGVEPNENNPLKGLVRHFNKIYNKRYK